MARLLRGPMVVFDEEPAGGTATKDAPAEGESKPAESDKPDDRHLADQGDKPFDQDKPADDDAPEGESETDKLKRRQRQADRRAKQAAAERDEALAKLKEREEAELDEKQKAEKRAEESEGKLAAANTKAQRANLRAAIADSEHEVASVADTATLLLNSDVKLEFNDDNEPTNLGDVLGDFLESRSHLLKGSGRVSGGSDAGKGSGGTSSLEEMSVEDHVKRISEHR